MYAYRNHEQTFALPPLNGYHDNPLFHPYVAFETLSRPIDRYEMGDHLEQVAANSTIISPARRNNIVGIVASSRPDSHKDLFSTLSLPHSLSTKFAMCNQYLVCSLQPSQILLAHMIDRVDKRRETE